jgi:multiple sugar transport system ATP-binding protein
MGDRIVVMSSAVVQQVGTPAQVYHDPANLFVARFIGSPGMNLVPGQYAGGKVKIPDCGVLTVPADWVLALDQALDGSGDVILGFRPEAAVVTDDGELAATVYAVDLHGGYSMLHLDLCNNQIVHARTSREVQYPLQAQVRFDLNPAMVRFFHPRTETAIVREVNS